MNIDYIKNFKTNLLINLEAIKDDMDARKDPDFFPYNGTQVYCGRQGSGKTLSMCRDILRLKEEYPKAKVVTNLQLNVEWKEDIILFQTMEQLADVLVNVNNGKLGVIYAIDEIHTYFNALDSKNIPPFVFTEISQQRKQRKLILGTSQLFLRLAKPFREQCNNIIICSTKFGLFTWQTAYDGMSISSDYDGNLIGDRKKSAYFFQTRELRETYDTFQKVISSSVEFEQYQVTNEKSKKGFTGRKK